MLTYWGLVHINNEKYYLFIVDNDDNYSSGEMTKLAEIIQLLRSKGMDDCVKTPAPSVDKDALRKYPTQDIVAVGASIEVDDVFWYEPDREKLERG